MAQPAIFGGVYISGETIGFGGYTSERLSTGVYKVKFDTPFSATAMVAVTPFYAEGTEGKPAAFPVLQGFWPDHFIVHIYDGGSNLVNMGFQFVASTGLQSS